VSDLVRSLLARRPYIQEGTLLDCLELADWLGLRIAAGIVPEITTAELMTRWQCSQPCVSRRISALRQHQLLDATDHPGRGAYWAVYRVGPAA
jgi:hypothetical protein